VTFNPSPKGADFPGKVEKFDDPIQELAWEPPD